LKNKRCVGGEGGLSNKARELMEAINGEAAKHNIWVRTQANAPAQRPWFSFAGCKSLL
jgi:hypothetical protein